MTMQPRPNNPIQKKKQEVRKHARNGVICVAVGLGGGFLLGLAATSFVTYMMLGIIVAVAGGVYNWSKIQKIVGENNSQN
ncbi:hypothetical protein ACTXN7_11250 [Corynebacterium flavescens]|uniref:hypothetical protein n=1 Tax=Corynebacterium flavescens TaxID=28028 RepID=UPI000EE1C892|nr:hypothetical protein [Corynebacterium flavescens]MDN6551242.1 hypothetical protein [Corynebacterium flavescens]MDN6600314.1 hypothetical protein [Corynebacterium flavescens]HCG45538.1 hypothetical protein [Corynebacterium flavescens]